MCISLGTLTGAISSIQHLPHYAMRILRDFQGLEVRLTDERLEHILEHPEMMGSETAIEDTLGYSAYLTDSVKRGWRLWPETE